MFFLFFHKTEDKVINTQLPPFTCPNCGGIVNAQEVVKLVHKGFFLLIPYKFTSYKVFCPNCHKMVKLPKELRGYLND